jgi:PadR family transcriptional regulator
MSIFMHTKTARGITSNARAPSAQDPHRQVAAQLWSRSPIQRASDDQLPVEEGSLYLAVDRMEQDGRILSKWALRETNRKAKEYRLSASGDKQVEPAEKSLEQLVKSVRAVLRYA